MTNNRTFSHTNLAYIFEISDNDDEFVIDIVQSYLATTPASMQQLVTAVGEYDSEQTLFQAHKLKGSFRFLGCNAIGDMLEELEQHAEQGSLPDALEMVQTIARHSEETAEELKIILQDLQSKL
jgi:HPt (histidine-containing phosphotransfer) domain-containing protein